LYHENGRFAITGTQHFMLISGAEENIKKHRGVLFHVLPMQRTFAFRNGILLERKRTMSYNGIGKT